MPRLVKPDAQPPERESDRDRAFHLAVREALLVFLRAYERRYLPELRKVEGGRASAGE